MSPFVRNLLIVAAVAVIVVVLNQETALATAGVLLRIAFVIAIAVVAYFYWRDSARHEIGLWPNRQQGIFYAAIALFVVDLGWLLMGHPQGRDALAVFVVAAVSAFVAVKTWLDQRRLL